ncbi:ATP-binding cassette domain-containing protein [Nonomuraea bangladeshensis]|uniref:ATP-binding cassette domain-containing protein n=1 Tax=Nonomuraea bangladeshensis TaxID=404385 RepID=UPI003C2F32A1
MIIEVENVRKRHNDTVEALRGVNLKVAEGELLAIIGPSGSGKSMLLNILGTLDRPTSGTVHVAGHDVSTLTDRQLSVLRALHLASSFSSFTWPLGSRSSTTWLTASSTRDVR